MNHSETSHQQILGADISMLLHLLEQGVTYRNKGRVVDPLDLLVASGFQSARLRLFHTPSHRGAQVNDLAYTKKLARLCAEAGMDILLCMHFSDTWADPGKQHTPSSWASLSFDQLVDEVYRYTAHAIGELADAGCCPSCVQVGNEITGGFLWDHGRLTEAHTINDLHWSSEELSENTEAWDRFARLLDAGLRGVRDGSNGQARTMIHIDRGGDALSADTFFSQLNHRGVDFDEVGLSFYPFWHGTINDLGQSIRRLYEHFGKPLHVVETAYPYRPHAIYDEASGEEVFKDLGITRTRPMEYPLTPEGQRVFVAQLLREMENHADHGWVGLWYWAPEWIEMPGYEDEPDAATCWARALFDAQGEPLPALEEFRRFSAEPLDIVIPSTGTFIRSET